MWLDIIIFICDLVTLFVLFLVISAVWLEWRNGANPINLSLLLFMLMNAITITYEIILRIILLFTQEPFEIYFGLLRLLFLLKIVTAAMYGLFFVYATNFQRAYTLPFVVIFYSIFYIIVSGDERSILWILMGFTIFATITLIGNGIKNRNGLTFAVGLSAFIFAVNFMPISYWVIFTSRIISSFILILGENGWWDNHVFYDRAKRKRIQSTWLSGRISSNSHHIR